MALISEGRLDHLEARSKALSKLIINIHRAIQQLDVGEDIRNVQDDLLESINEAKDA